MKETNLENLPSNVLAKIQKELRNNSAASLAMASKKMPQMTERTLNNLQDRLKREKRYLKNNVAFARQEVGKYRTALNNGTINRNNINNRYFGMLKKLKLTNKELPLEMRFLLRNAAVEFMNKYPNWVARGNEYNKLKTNANVDAAIMREYRNLRKAYMNKRYGHSNAAMNLISKSKI